MSAPISCILTFLLMTALILIGIPLCVSMLGCALLGFCVINGP